jgi:hypothetical protein
MIRYGGTAQRVAAETMVAGRNKTLQYPIEGIYSHYNSDTRKPVITMFTSIAVGSLCEGWMLAPNCASRIVFLGSDSRLMSIIDQLQGHHRCLPLLNSVHLGCLPRESLPTYLPPPSLLPPRVSYVEQTEAKSRQRVLQAEA